MLAVAQTLKEANREDVEEMTRLFLMLILVASSGMLHGQNMTYDFTITGLNIKDWRSVLTSVTARGYNLPNKDSLTADGLILKSAGNNPTFLTVTTATDILPGWRGDVLELHEPYVVKYAASKMKMMLKGGTDGDVIAARTTEVRGLMPGSADLRNVECNDPQGCYVELIMWSHDSLENIALNRLKKVEIRSQSPVTTIVLAEVPWLGEVVEPKPGKYLDNTVSLAGQPGSSSSVKWRSGRILSYGWRGEISESHLADNPYRAGSISIALKGYGNHTVFATATANSGGSPLGNARVKNGECNDPLGCYVEVELFTNGDGSTGIQNELVSISLVHLADGDDYDVGVFYMPFWHNDGNTPYWSSDNKSHRWHIVDRYNQAMQEQGLKNYILKPLDIYGSDSSPASYYNEEDLEVNLKHLSLMKEYGVDFVIYDSYFQYYRRNSADTVYEAKRWAPFWNQVVANVSGPSLLLIPFAIMWSNDFTSMVYNPNGSSSRANPRGCRGFFEPDGGLDRLINHWDTILSNPNYKRIEDKPALYIYFSGTKDKNLGGFTNSLEGLCGYCADDPFFDPLGPQRYESGLHAAKTSFLLKTIEDRLEKDIYFVAAVSSGTAWQDPLQKADWYLSYPTLAGFDAVTSYAFSAFDNHDIFVEGRWWNWDYSYDYNRMAEAYSKYYSFLLDQNYSTLTNTNLKFQIPVTAGFNRGSSNMHENKGVPENGYMVDIWDQAISTPESFEAALVKAKEQVNAFPNQTSRNITLCCWNEYAEGTVIEPTTTWGYSYLEKVKKVFATEEQTEKDDLPVLKVEEPVEQKTADDLPGKDEVEIKPILTEKMRTNYLNIFPNPIQRQANIRFSIADKTTASIQILNAMGQVVQDLINDTMDSGVYEIIWDASAKPKGFYFCRIVTNDFVEVKKLVLTH